MPSVGYSVTNTFQNQVGPIPLSQLDTNFTQPANAFNTLANFNNYFQDASGAPNVIVVTAPAPLVLTSYTTGLRLSIRIAITNTSTAVTINANALGTRPVVNSDGTVPQIGQLVANSIVDFTYDGTSFQIQSPTASTIGLFGNGSAGNPSISFASDPNTGVFRVGPDDLGFTAGGTLQMDISTTQITTALNVAPNADATNSLGLAAKRFTTLFASTVSEGATATGALLGSSGTIVAHGAGSNWTQHDFRVAASTVFSITSGGFFTPAGSAGSPSHSFQSNGNCGMYSTGSNAIGFSTSSTLRADISSAGVFSYGGIEIGYRGIGSNSQNAGYAFVAADRGRGVAAATAGAFTLNSGLFNTGDIITFYNTTGSNCTLTQGAGVNIRLMGSSGTTGNRTVADFGVCTIIAQNSTVFLAGGPGVS